MGKVKVEAVTVDEAIRRVHEAYVGNTAEFKKDLNNAIKAAQERTEIQSASVNETKRLKM